MTKLQFCIILFSFVRYFRQSLEPGIKLKDLYYFREECSNKGGTNGGSCASGFGVCCTCKLQFIGYIQRVPTNKYFRLWEFFKTFV